MTISKVLDRVRQLLNPDSEERNEALSRYVKAEQRRVAATGQAGAGIAHIRDYCIQDLADRAAHILATITRVHKTLAPLRTETTAAELRQVAGIYLNDARLRSQEVVRQEFERVTGRREIVAEINLDPAYARELNRLNANIDLYVDAYVGAPERSVLPTMSTFENRRTPSFVDPARLASIRAIPKGKFDYSRLAAMCAELNECAARENAHAVIMLTRAILDHVPPIFGARNFSDVANNHSPSRSFKEAMLHLNNGSRKIADLHLHTQIRSQEDFPNMTQVNFSSPLDLLLSEIVRRSKEPQKP